MKKIILALIITIIAVFSFGCSSDKISESIYEDFILKLEERGFEVTSENVDKDILQGERKWLTVNKTENMSIFLYKSNESADEDAARIEPHGTGYNNGNKEVQISWVSLPHFYKKDNMIVLYCGENEYIISGLNQILGSQFAGYKG